jgi:hypothetical protein
MRAKRVDGNHAEIRDHLRKFGYAVEDTHEQGGGFPDLVVLSKSDIVVLVEVKMPGKGLTTDEVTFFEKFKHAALEIVYSKEDAIQKLSLWDERIIVWKPTLTSPKI